MDLKDCIDYCVKAWSEGGSALEGLKDFIRIPNLSPDYDPEFLTNGLITKCVDTVKNWVEAQGIKGLTTTVHADPGRQPLLQINIEGSNPDATPILAYGHLDKMPHLDAAGWSEGLGATKPVIRDDKLYGRGANDDGYNVFLVITAVKYLQSKGLKYPKITCLYETGEESGDEEIQKYLHDLRPKIGDAGSILVLDAEAQDYNTFWCCTSLRGVVIGVLEISHLAAPCHSGMATGLVPSTFRIARMLLSRIEDEQTGEIKFPEAHIQIPENRITQSRAIANQLGERCVEIVQPLPGCKLITDDLAQLLINKAWKPGLAITGADGIPAVQDGSNVMRKNTTLKLSLRLPPGVDAEKAGLAMKKILEADPPYGAKVTFTLKGMGNGYFAKDYTEKVDKALAESTKAVFNAEPLYYGEGGSIPLCNTFHELWPTANILVTGCAGTDSNPHGYDESVNIPYTQKFTAFIASFIEKVGQ